MQMCLFIQVSLTVGYASMNVIFLAYTRIKECSLLYSEEFLK
jgi:hypothetical protein